ncbi:hypothetical protein BDV23DRAFT_183372 [Aspergillus alliaceus]|uniref:Uncharacterized protein n=1 Tax=Petromyces alliaceus TaxID=209559 RepID=A0A5N7C8I5_PETAA|nr:hypothetical protein BDV23DRAFT_183372 [Aspergillus alliaceus]
MPGVKIHRPIQRPSTFRAISTIPLGLCLFAITGLALNRLPSRYPKFPGQIGPPSPLTPGPPRRAARVLSTPLRPHSPFVGLASDLSHLRSSPATRLSRPCALGLESPRPSRFTPRRN